MVLFSKTTEESSLIATNIKCLKGFSSTKGKNGEVSKKVLNLCMWLYWNNLLCCSNKTSGCFFITETTTTTLDIPDNFLAQNCSWICLFFQKRTSERNSPAFKGQDFLICSLPRSHLFYCHLLCITMHRSIKLASLPMDKFPP